VKAPPDVERRPRRAAVQAPNMDPAKNRVKALAHERSTSDRPGEQRDATVELTILLYGPAAELGPTPPGPDVCPPWCPYCYAQPAATVVGELPDADREAEAA
jgi:hypothetical protein